MAEIVLRIIGVLIHGLIDRTLETTGRRVLSAWGVKSNLFVEVLVGILCWSIFVILLMGLGSVLLMAMRAAHSN